MRPEKLVLLAGVVKVNSKNLIINYILYHNYGKKFYPKVLRDSAEMTSVREDKCITSAVNKAHARGW